MYFYYGIKHSTLEEGSANIELEATKVITQVSKPKKVSKKENFEQYDMSEYDNPAPTSAAAATSSSEPPAYAKDLFVPPSAFPTWDD